MRAGTKEWYAYWAGSTLERSRANFWDYLRLDDTDWLRMAAGNYKEGLCLLAKSDDRFQSMERFNWLNQWFGAD